MEDDIQVFSHARELKKITQEELDEIIRRHEMWLDSDGEAGEQADLSYTDLSGLNLANANLRGANMESVDLVFASLEGANLLDANLLGAKLMVANLKGANLLDANLLVAKLTGAKLIGANLEHANLRSAKLVGARLEGANLLDANLKHADLMVANLEGANLTRANMKFADLERANLGHADLTFADLKDANLKLADLTGVNLTNVKNLPDISMPCPATGSFIGWKSADNNFIIKLEIPEDAKRSSAIGSRKCRCNKAKVLSIEHLDGTPAEVTSVRSRYETEFIYTLGETVEEELFDENRFRECSTGIHFFMTREEAGKYLLSQILNGV